MFRASYSQQDPRRSYLLNTYSPQEKLKANTQSISSDVGSGAHGHPRLVLSPAEYTLVSNTPYEIPPHPGALALPRNVDAVEAVHRKKSHQERIRKFREALDIQKELIRQIIATTNPQYMDELHSPTTITITKTIPEILQYLFNNFVNVTSSDVAQEEAKVRNYFYL